MDGVVALNATANCLALNTVNEPVAAAFVGAKDGIAVEYKRRTRG